MLIAYFVGWTLCFLICLIVITKEKIRLKEMGLPVSFDDIMHDVVFFGMLSLGWPIALVLSPLALATYIIKRIVG